MTKHNGTDQVKDGAYTVSEDVARVTPAYSVSEEESPSSGFDFDEVYEKAKANARTYANVQEPFENSTEAAKITYWSFMDGVEHALNLVSRTKARSLTTGSESAVDVKELMKQGEALAAGYASHTGFGYHYMQGFSKAVELAQERIARLERENAQLQAGLHLSSQKLAKAEAELAALKSDRWPDRQG